MTILVVSRYVHTVVVLLPWQARLPCDVGVDVQLENFSALILVSQLVKSLGYVVELPQTFSLPIIFTSSIQYLLVSTRHLGMYTKVHRYCVY